MSARRLINAATLAGVSVVFWGAALASLELAALGATIGAIACVIDYSLN